MSKTFRRINNWVCIAKTLFTTFSYGILIDSQNEICGAINFIKLNYLCIGAKKNAAL